MTAPVLTIDLNAIAANWRALAALAPTAEPAAVIKADGYGCGAAEVGRALSAAGCRRFFVATLDEAIALRAALPDAAVYILGGILTPGDAAEAKSHSLRPVLNSLRQIGLWTRAEGGGCAVQICSGMNRLGLSAAETAALRRDPATLRGIRPDLVMTHLACADEPAHPQNAAQRARFLDDAAALFPGLPRSLSATGGVLLGADYHLEIIRPGVGLFGGAPYAAARPVVRLDLPILQIRDIEPGEAVGYGATWRAERPARIATLGAGYADGLMRALTGKGRAYIDGRPMPFAGRVSMDVIGLDVTDAPEAREGDFVEILGPNQSVDALADAAGTIGYEVLTSLGARHLRRYIGAAPGARA